MTSIVPELQSLAPSAIIELFELHTSLELHGTSEIYRFHSGANQRISRGDVVWAGNRYQRFPIEVDGFDYNGKQLPRPTLRVSNLFGVITSILLNVNDLTPGNDLIGAKVIRIRTCARYLDAINFENNQNPYGSPDPTAEAPREIYFIDRKSAENRDVVEFELAAALDLVNVKLPGRQCISSICQWEYRSPECGYTGSAVFDENDQPGTLVAAENFPAGTSTLTTGQNIQTNEFLVSSNRWYKAVMQEDGNFVVYSKALKAVWSTLTYGKGPSIFKYQEDGNLVIYDAFNRPTWNSNTQNQASITALTFTKLLPDQYPRGDDDSLQLVAAPNFPAGTSSVTSAGSGFKLYPGESLTSSNGWYQLLMQRDGNFVVYNKANDPVWFTGTGEPSFAWFQPDGNLVLYRYSDGAAIWNSGTYLLPTSSSPATNFTSGTTTLLAGDTSSSKLLIGQQLVSENGWYRLKMQSDGNLVLYSKAQNFTGPDIENYNIAIWNTGTYGSGATYAHFQSDGNFVLYDSSNTAVWFSNNGSYPQYAGKRLVLENNGNLVIYGADGNSTTEVPATNFPTGTGQILCANQESSKLYVGQTLYSENGWYKLSMESSGRLVLTNKANVAIWSLGSSGSGATYAYFQADGNLVLYNSSDVAVDYLNRFLYPQWQGYRWKLERTGDLVLYSATNTVLWRSFTATNAEPSITVTDGTTDTPLWFTSTSTSTEPRSPVYPVSTLLLGDTGTLSISVNSVTSWTNGYNNENEPQVQEETGDNRLHAFLWEIFGSADDQTGTTKTVSRSYTFGTRTIAFTYVGTANFTLPVDHYSEQTLSWTLDSETYTTSTGKWYLDEFLEVFISTSETNPFRNHPYGTISPVGRQYRINGVLNSAGTLTLEDDGNFVQYNTSNDVVWSSNYSSNLEPKVPGDGGSFVDVCGKRLSSCQVRFGTDVDLPFGSFPGVGQYFV